MAEKYDKKILSSEHVVIDAIGILPDLVAAVELLGYLLDVFGAHFKVLGGQVGYLVLWAASARYDDIATAKAPVEHNLDRRFAVLFGHRYDKRIVDDISN